MVSRKSQGTLRTQSASRALYVKSALNPSLMTNHKLLGLNIRINEPTCVRVCIHGRLRKDDARVASAPKMVTKLRAREQHEQITSGSARLQIRNITQGLQRLAMKPTHYLK